MSTRLKERGGAGGKVMAPPAKPSHRVLPSATPTEKSGKENYRALSTGRSSVPRQRPCGSAEAAEKPAVIVPGGVRWSTSSLPKGKACSSNPPQTTNFSMILSDLRHSRVSAAGAGVAGKAVEALPVVAERRSFSGGRVLERCQQKKGVSDSSNVKGKDGRRSISEARVPESRRVNGVQRPSVIKQRNGDVPVNGSSSSHDCTKKRVSPEMGTDLKRAGAKSCGAYSRPVGVEPKKDAVMRKRVAEISQGREKSLSSLDALKQRSVTEPIVLGISKADHVVFDSKSSKEAPSDVAGVREDSKGTGCGVPMSSSISCLKSALSTIAIENIAVNASNESKSEAATAGHVSNNISVFESVHEHTGEKNDGQMNNKHPSKLREKLALLEGKVQRIATDIMRTKEMLDSNSTDASKVMLSDIQKKILGIEKAVDHVVKGGQGELGLDESTTEKHQTEHSRKSRIIENQDIELGGLKNPAKNLSTEELEARFFPHQKLLKSRSTLGNSADQDKNYKHVAANHNFDVMVNEALVERCINENPIALEFLASLNSDQSKMITRDREHQARNGLQSDDVDLLADEKSDDLDDQENKSAPVLKEEPAERPMDILVNVGTKPVTGGWFVAESEAALLVHLDGTCTYYDVTNDEEKSEYKAPTGLSPNLWRDCWVIRAPGFDGCYGKYIIAASAGNTVESGFCSWDFHKKDIKAFKLEKGTSRSFVSLSSEVPSPPLSSRAVLAPLTDLDMRRRGVACFTPSDDQQSWYRPCGCLILSTQTQQNIVNAYDIRDGCLAMTWTTQNPIVSMEYSSPLQWRTRGKVIVAGTETLSLWDVNSLNPQPLQSVSLSGKSIVALHVNNTEAEFGGGIRQRVNSSDAEGNDGVFCTQESINKLDFRLPSGVGFKISNSGFKPQSVFSRGDSILVGCAKTRPPLRGSSEACIQSFSIRQGKLLATYTIPNTAEAHSHYSSVSQVWGNNNLIMAVCGMGLAVCDAVRDEVNALRDDACSGHGVKEMIGPDDLYYPSFDYVSGRILLISRDRPAMWRYLF